MKPVTATAAARGVLFLVLLALAYWIYAPGTAGPMLLDDRSSLGALDHLAASPEQAWDFVLGDNSGPLGRPVSMATFVLEKLLGDGSVATAKTVNVLLHLAVGAIAACLFSLLLGSVGIPLPMTAAVLFAGFWLLAPLHVSTVLYVVQRMAMLAAFFSLLALVFYLLWRRGLARGEASHSLLLLTFACVVLAVLSKENGVLAISLVLLTEAFWLQFRDDAGRPIPWLRRVTLSLIIGGCLAAAVLLMVFWGSLAEAHRFREFTLVERLLSQGRIVWDYVGQFYFPDTGRMGIYHDDLPVSRSLLQPVSTAYALLSWVLLLLLVPVLWRWTWPRRLLYGPLFFLAAHAMESTVWPLELYFEHRNYLPSLGLVLLPLSVYAMAVVKWPEVKAPLLGWCALAILAISLQTSAQVVVWSSNSLLVLHHANGHPQSARANKDLATHLATVGARDASLKYSRLAHQVGLGNTAADDEHYGDLVLRNIALACIAGEPLSAGEYSVLGEKEPDRPLGDVSTMSVVIKLRQDDVCPGFDWEGFQDYLASLYLVDFDTRLASANMFSALAMLANAQQHWEHAHAYTARYLSLAPGSIRGMLMQLHFSTALGRLAEAEDYIVRLQQLEQAGKLSRGEQSTLALYLEN